jgi:hypothetical protein
MRYEASVTSISWIPSEAMSGPMRVPMDVGMGHYDPPPPDAVAGEEELDELLATDRFRFANRLAGWVEFEEGAAVASGYSGGGLVGSTTIAAGVGHITVPGVGYPVIQHDVERLEDGGVRFTQTAGGRTGAPLPHRISRPPFIRLTAPTAWTTLTLTIGPDGSSSFDVVGASPFPRHWVYDTNGALAAKSGTIDFAEWTRRHDHDNTPWNDRERAAAVAEVESELERRISVEVMSGKPRLLRLGEADTLVRQGEEGDEMYLVLDGMLVAVVDGEPVAEIGPGAIVGERSALEGGVRTATLEATTRVKVAAFPAGSIDEAERREVAEMHRREE